MSEGGALHGDIGDGFRRFLEEGAALLLSFEILRRREGVVVWLIEASQDACDVLWLQSVVVYFHVVEDGFDQWLKVTIVILKIGYEFVWDGFFEVKEDCLFDVAAKLICVELLDVDLLDHNFELTQFETRFNN